MGRVRSIKWEECDFLPDDLDIFDDDSEEEGSFNESKVIPRFIVPNNQFMTILGPIDKSDKMHPVFNTLFVQADINFNFTKDMLEAISKLDGVEFVRAVTRYRFVIGVGRLFEPNEVRETVEKYLGVESTECASLVPDEVSEILNEIKGKVKPNEKWVVYIFPNGEHICKIDKSQEKIAEKLREFKILQEESNGMVFTNLENR